MMGKGEELWDDSALINAFDNAMSNYKKMHGKNSKDNSIDGVSAAIRDADEKSNVTFNAAAELGEAKNHTPVVPELCIDSSSGHQGEVVNDYSSAQNAQGYNQLLSQYYDLEEKRQMILHQLQQLGGYDYQYNVEGFGSTQQFGTCYTSHDHSVPTSQPDVSSCCPYACCLCSAVPRTSFSDCSFNGTCDHKMCKDSSSVMGPAKSLPLVDDDIVKVAMEAVKRAIASMKRVSSINSGTEEKEKVEQKDSEENMSQSTRSETDISVVLNAWYSAGFYTGKYLTEQSIMKK